MYVETSQSSSPSESKLKLYKEIDELDDGFTDPLTYWKMQNTKFPILSSLEKKKKMLCVTAIPVPMESLFNSTSFVVNRLRSSLDPENENVPICLQH